MKCIVSESGTVEKPDIFAGAAGIIFCPHNLRPENGPIACVNEFYGNMSVLAETKHRPFYAER
jgi:hypothetical protein